MPRYLYLGRYTSGGVKGVMDEGGTGREEETRRAFERLGGTIEQYLFAVGPDFDFVIIADMPDTTTAVVPPMLASGTGTVDVRTTLLLSPQELDAACATARSIRFRAAGS